MQFQFNRLWLVLITFAVLGVIAPLVVLQPWKQPSREMKAITAVEKQLSLPKAEKRVVVDRGQYRDDDGAHNVRQVVNYYAAAQPVATVSAALQPKGWEAKPSNTVDGITIITYVHRLNNMCIELRMAKDAGSKDQDGPINRVILMAESDDSCSGYLATYQ